jgi:hypothetical protein
MAQYYVPYIRFADGTFRRISDGVFNSPHAPYPYMHEAPLLGWPEPKVFWARESGASMGIAPVTNL